MGLFAFLQIREDGGPGNASLSSVGCEVNCVEVDALFLLKTFEQV